MMSIRCKLSSGGYKRSILSLGLPILMGQIGIMVTGYADTLMVGHYGTEELASASFVNNVIMFLLMLSLGYSYGFTPLVAGFDIEKYGATRFGALLRSALRANAAFCAVPIALLAVMGLLLDHMGQPENLLPTIRPYYWINLVSMAAVVPMNVYRQLFDGMGRTRITMSIVLVSNALNVLLNYILIFGHFGAPELGLTGAGIATFVSRVVMLLSCVVMARVVLPKQAFAAEPCTDAMRVHRNSWPVALQIGVETGIFTMASIMAGWLGECPLASYQLLVMIGQIGFMVYYSFGSSMSIKVAYCHGRGNQAEVLRYTNAGYGIILACAAFASAVFLIFGRQLAAIFSPDPAVVALTAATMVPLTLYQFGDATQTAFANALRGISHVLPMMRYAVFCYVIVGIPACYLLAFTAHLGLQGLYYGFFIALMLAGMLFAYEFRKAINSQRK